MCGRPDRDRDRRRAVDPAGSAGGRFRSACRRRLLIRRGADAHADGRGPQGISARPEAGRHTGAAPVEPKSGHHLPDDRGGARTGRALHAQDLRRKPGRARPDGGLDGGHRHIADVTGAGAVPDRRSLAGGSGNRNRSLDRRLCQPVRSTVARYPGGLQALARYAVNRGRLG